MRYDAVWLGRQVAYFIIESVIIQGVAIESYDFQIAVFMKWFGYRKQKMLQSKITFKFRFILLKNYVSCLVSLPHNTLL
jgi:hypothetical protein